MSLERTRIAAIFGAVALATAGGGYYFFAIYRPDHVRADAQRDVVAWEARWSAARACLLGATPGSTRTSEALAIREMSPDPWDRGSCAPLVGRLSRGAGADSGLLEVEAAWAVLDHAASKAALAFANHIAMTTPTRVDPLPAALDELEVARGKLRAAAELPAEVAVGHALAAAQIIALRDGDEPVTQLEHLGTLPSAHGSVGFGHTASHAVQLVLAAGAAPKVLRIAPGSLRAVPDPSWGATPGVDDGTVRAGAINVEGAMVTPSQLRIADGGSTGDVIIAAALGGTGDRIVAFHTDTKLAIARGETRLVSDPIVAIDEDTARVFADVDGRAVISWRAGGKLYVQLLQPGTHGTPIVVPAAGQIAAACFSRDRAWLRTDTARLHSLRDQTLGAEQVADADLAGCAPDGALTHDAADLTTYQICTDACRTLTLPAAPNQAIVTIIDGQLVAIAAHDGILGVWSERGKPRFYTLPQATAPELPAMALTDGKVIDLIASGREGFELVRIPAQ